ncbi:hypothetical protein [Streptomyces doebereineriae]
MRRDGGWKILHEHLST